MIKAGRYGGTIEENTAELYISHVAMTIDAAPG